MVSHETISTLPKVSHCFCSHRAVAKNWLVRTTRARIIRLRNDHKEVMSHLEKGIHNHFANLQRAQTAAPSIGNVDGTPGSMNGVSETGATGLPFAKVNSVVPGSPADQAGLRVGDTIRGFGSANWLNHERLSKVAEIVQQSEGVRCFRSSLAFCGLMKILQYCARLEKSPD